MKIKNILLTLCTSLLLTNVAAHAKEVKIGMAIDDLRLERWQKDRDIFVKKAALFFIITPFRRIRRLPFYPYRN